MPMSITPDWTALPTSNGGIALGVHFPDHAFELLHVFGIFGERADHLERGLLGRDGCRKNAHAGRESQLQNGSEHGLLLVWNRPLGGGVRKGRCGWWICPYIMAQWTTSP